MSEPLLRSFFVGGFESSTHVLRNGRRLDLVHSTRHDELARQDYRRLRGVGIATARDAVRWHLAEPVPGRYDFETVRPMIGAALEEKVQVLWDLLHFGWPGHVDVFAPEFPERFAAFAMRFAEVLRSEGDREPAVAPINEISFLSFAAGEAGFFNPFAHGRGDEIKRQFVRAALAAGRAVRSILPNARLVHTDPIIHVVAHPDRPEDEPRARAHEAAQYESWDMIAGRREPSLGGSPDQLDVIGVNYYVHNQWCTPGGHRSMIRPSSPRYRPVRDMLLEVSRRYGRPLFIAETGIEDETRPAWLRFMAHEARTAIRNGADVQGLCLYPIVNHPGWEDDRHCKNGLWDYADARGHRPVYEPLAAELERQIILVESMDVPGFGERDEEPDLAQFDSIAEWVAEATDRSRA